MPLLVLALIPLSLALALPLTALLIRLGHRLRTFDSPGVAGQVKAAARNVPNTGGIAIFWAIALPILAALASVWLSNTMDAGRSLLPEAVAPHLPGIRQETPLALLLIASLLLLHILGLIDDRTPLGPWLKLAIMAAPALAIPAITTLAPGFSETRLLTFLDGYTGGPYASIALTALWILIVTNALNFMDNMDGLAAGVAAIAGACFLAATLISGQWFVGAVLALLIGACLGFLVFNFPRPGSGGARIFMGDGGSLVLGFLLAFLTVRTTFVAPAGDPTDAARYYAVLMPLIVLAVPIYDCLSVVTIRLSQRRSPFVGDMQHLSHRLVNHGLSRRAAVLIIYGLTAITGLSAIPLASLQPWQAVLVGIQTILMLIVIALFEYASTGNTGSGRA